MSEHTDKTLSDPVVLARTRLPNRIIRSATYEGMADTLGMPQQTLTRLYTELLEGGTGTLITGALHVRPEGKLPWPHQGSADSPQAFSHWEPILNQLHRHSPHAILVAQLCHGGALSAPTRNPDALLAPSAYRTDSGHTTTAATEQQLQEVIEAFARAARLAMEIGFDAIQLHAADGYLIHQFLSPETNHRTDAWGQTPRLLLDIIERIRQTSGQDLPIWVKLPWMDDDPGGIRLEQTRGTADKLDAAGVELCELSYGTMRHPASVSRGELSARDWAAAHPLLRAMPASRRAIWPLTAAGRHYRSRPCTPAYNARSAKQLSASCQTMTVIPSGGIHTLDAAQFCIRDLGLEAIGLSRPLIHNPRLPLDWLAGRPVCATCSCCNQCLLATFSHTPLACLGDLRT